jgi:hypothetical protein
MQFNGKQIIFPSTLEYGMFKRAFNQIRQQRDDIDMHSNGRLAYAK